MKFPARAAVVLLAASLVATTVSAGDRPPTLDAVAVSFDIPHESVLKLRLGEVVTRELEPAAPTEIGVALAVLVRRPMKDVLAFVASDAWFAQDRETLAHGALDPARPQEGLAQAGLVVADQAEVGRLLHAGPGDELNLSSGEITTLREALAPLGVDPSPKDPRIVESVNAALRALLAGRVEAYRSKGLSGIAPYARGPEDATDPAPRLQASLSATPLLRERAPKLLEALERFPGEVEGVRQGWLWLEQRAQGRPVFVLSHRMATESPGAVFAAERQYHVGHSWDGALVLGGLLQTDSGTLLVYANRVHTDAVAGGLGALKRNVGRRMMEKSIRAFFQSVKREAEAR